jgi:co-chaperonin GroES (HSP10)
MLKPVLHRILVKPEDISESDEVLRKARAAGLHVELDKREKEAGVIGVVVAIGSTAYREFNTTAEEQGVVVGARVYYAKYAGAKTKDGQNIWLNDEDILGVITDDN